MLLVQVVWGADRDQAIARARTALAELRIGGLETTVAFHRAILSHPVFLEGGFTTNLLDRVGPAAFVAGTERG